MVAIIAQLAKLQNVPTNVDPIILLDHLVTVQITPFMTHILSVINRKSFETVYFVTIYASRDRRLCNFQEIV